jgi:hypothetical protein
MGSPDEGTWKACPWHKKRAIYGRGTWTYHRWSGFFVETHGFTIRAKAMDLQQ